MATTHARAKFTDTYWIIPEYETTPYGKVSFTRQDRRTFVAMFKDSRLIWAGVNLCMLTRGRIDMNSSQQEKIKPEISINSHIKLTRAREMAAYLYEHIKNHSCDGESMPWLPEILDYLCGDIDVIFREIDEWELRDSQSRMARRN